jgi:hypothetical protein
MALPSRKTQKWLTNSRCLTVRKVIFITIQPNRMKKIKLIIAFHLSVFIL